MYLDFTKDYRLNALPRDENGNVLYQGDSDEEYEQYVHWLADYLYTVPVECSPRQSVLCEQAKQPNKRHVAGSLGGDAFWHDSGNVEIELAMMDVLGDGALGTLEDVTDEQAEQILAARLEWLRGDDDEECGDETLQAGEEAIEAYDSWDPPYPVFTADDVRAILVQYRDRTIHFGDEGNNWEEDFLDIGWRVPLAILLQDVPDREEQTNLLREFFIGYYEDAWK